MSKDIRNLQGKVKNFDQFVNESEEYNNIVEELPIKVDVKKSWTGKYYNINVSPMKMKYETFLKLGSNLTDDQIKYGKEKQNTKYTDTVELYSNDVSASSYDYRNGEASFSGTTEKDIRNWLELYKDYVYADNF